ncbi:unnamed protein product [Echinostoma caproni]|uniref:PRELI/MSF1 domain-containing protein n=1 Tax=Echinostoma caproni TaxID=27848 RepID=A0A183BEC5_9TREM|nr:unnamed protein product [Echinostoma caproni]
MLSGRKGWEEESTIKAPWEDVMRSVQNKYPNPHNNNVLNIDVVNRSVDQQSGVMRSLRLFNSSWPMFPNLGQLKALEWSAIDGRRKKMVAVTHNMDLRGVLKAVEHVEYSVHPENDHWTLLRHSISVEAFPLIALTASSASRQAAIQVKLFSDCYHHQ